MKTESKYENDIIDPDKNVLGTAVVTVDGNSKGTIVFYVGFKVGRDEETRLFHGSYDRCMAFMESFEKTLSEAKKEF